MSLKVLPEVLADNGLNIIRVMPKYKQIEDKYNLNEITSFIIEINDKAEVCQIYEHRDEKVITYFIASYEYFERDNYYGYEDDDIRFGFFSKAVLQMVFLLDMKLDIIHLNDWHTGLISVLLREKYNKIHFYNKIKTIYTIHNLKYQGVFGKDSLERLGLSYRYYDSEILEYYGNISFMKGGLICSDLINTVSYNYSKEIQTPALGYGLDGVLRKYQDKICGILNGIHYDKFNSETDKYIHVNYNINNVIKAKEKNKYYLQKKVNLSTKKVPLLGMVSRLSEQKGLDLCIQAIEKLIGEDIQFVILGTGENKYENKLKSISDKYPDKVKVIIDFNNEMARHIYAGSDFFLMPSLFEPCGLSQIYSMRFGTVPIVRKTGGLVDTVIPFDKIKLQGTGFMFDEYNINNFLKAIKEGLNIYDQKDIWNSLVKNCMNQRFTWDKSAKEYIKKYKELL